MKILTQVIFLQLTAETQNHPNVTKSVLTFSFPTLVHFSFSAVAAKSEDIMMLIMTSSLVCVCVCLHLLQVMNCLVSISAEYTVDADHTEAVLTAVV